MNSSFECAHRVKFDLFRRYGMIAAAGDRHLAEFMPGNEYLNDPETVTGWKFGLTTVDWRKEDLKNRLEKSRKLVAGEEQVELKPTGEEGIQLIKALCRIRIYRSKIFRQMRSWRQTRYLSGMRSVRLWQGKSRKM